LDAWDRSVPILEPLWMNAETKEFKWVGTRPVRPDGVPKVTGRAQYGADYRLSGELIGKVLRSPHAHAYIRGIDTSKAEALPGVKAVVTAADFPDHAFAYIGPERVAQNFWHITRNIMAREKALYEGHAVAAVAHEAEVPFAAIRAIGDPAERSIPRAALPGLSPSGRTRALPVIAGLLRRPGDVVGVWRLANETNTALSALQAVADAGAIDALD